MHTLHRGTRTNFVIGRTTLLDTAYQFFPTQLQPPSSPIFLVPWLLRDNLTSEKQRDILISQCWLEGMQSSLPYPIPGPAGVFSSTRSGSEGCAGTERSLVDTTTRKPRARSSGSNSLKSFDTTGWHALLLAYDLRPYGPDLLSSSIALIKSNAFRGNFQRLRLAVRVEKMHFVGKNASVTLADPTGTIVATVLAEVFEDRKCGVQEGAVLMLESVTAIMYPERKPAGFYINLDAALHMSIQSSNIVHVFSEADELEVERKELIMSYSEEALRLPNADQQTLRKQRSVVFDAGESSVSAQPRPISGYNEQSRSDNRGVSGNYRYSKQQPYNSRMRPPQRSSNTDPYGRNTVQERRRDIQGNAQNQAYRRPNPYRPFRREFDNPSNQCRNKRPAEQQGAPILRPSQRPRSFNNSQASPAPNKVKPTETLTDDQLDDLLGSVDIDAAIAAATQPTTTPIDKANHDTVPSSLNNSRNSETERPASPVQDNAKKGTEVMQPVNVSNNAADTLTDDQLDVLLGSVDMDSLLDS